MKKKHLQTIVALIVAYVFMLWLLVWAESFSVDASITSMKDALWYSVVTMTTVGYGDLAPVTVAGKLIGGVFLLLSTSLVALLVVMVITFGQLYAIYRLNRLQKNEWYIFSALNTHTVALAHDIRTADPDGVIIFPKENSENPLVSDVKGKNVFFLKGNVKESFALRRDADGCHLFFTGEDSYINYRDALPFSGTGCNIYCMSGYAPQQTPADIAVFSPYSICARTYWQKQSLEQAARNVVIIGGGSFASALLEQALLVNVFAPQQSVNYHIFGNEEFKKLHHSLNQVVSVDSENSATDNLIYHTDSWMDDATLLLDADRILIWEDNDDANLKTFTALTDYFVTKGIIHLRLSQSVPGAISFGGDDEIFNTHMVMGTDAVKTAKALHNQYLQSTGSSGPAWEELSVFTRKSNIAVADHIQTKIRILLEDDTITDINSELCRKAYDVYLGKAAQSADFFRHVEHNRWMRFYAMYGWQYAPQRNNNLKLHPSMVPFEQLSEPERAKDDNSWLILNQLAEILKDR